LPKQEADALLARAKEDANWKEVPVRQESYRIGTNEWFRHMLDKVQL